jgi:hypothetical protein
MFSGNKMVTYYTILASAIFINTNKNAISYYIKQPKSNVGSIPIARSIFPTPCSSRGFSFFQARTLNIKGEWTFLSVAPRVGKPVPRE